MKKFSLSFLVIFLVSAFESLADDYRPDDASCLKYEGLKCAEIDQKKYDDCVFDMSRRFIFDDKHRIIGARGGSDVLEIKKDKFMMKTISEAGCDHHSSQVNYYFNYKAGDEKFTCEKAMSLFNKIGKEFGKNEQNCILLEPQNDALAGQCNILDRLSGEERYKDDYSCEQSLVTGNGGLLVESSDVDGYDFKIRETGYND